MCKILKRALPFGGLGIASAVADKFDKPKKEPMDEQQGTIMPAGGPFESVARSMRQSQR